MTSTKNPPHHVGVIGGDGIGPEVTAQALRVLEAAGLQMELTHYDLGAARFLRDGTVLPDETLGYLARVAPRLGMAAELPLPAVAQGWRRGDGAYAGTYGNELAAADPADRAFDGGGLVTPWAPTGERTGRGTGSGT